MERLNNLIKSIVSYGLGSVFGVTQWRIFGNSLTVFCYHDVTDTPSDFSRENALNVPPDAFNFQIEYIKKNFNLIEPKQLLEQSIPSNAALVTFDDGFKI